MKAGIFTIALVALTTVKVCNPLPESIWSTVKVLAPLVIIKAPKPPGNKLGSSETVIIGVQPFCGVGVGVGVGVGIGVGVGVDVGVGVGIGVGVGAGEFCVIVKTRPETVNVPVRAALVLFDATVKFIVALLLPLVGVSVIQFSLLRAIHPLKQLFIKLTATLPLPPLAPKV